MNDLHNYLRLGMGCLQVIIATSVQYDWQTSRCETQNGKHSNNWPTFVTYFASKTATTWLNYDNSRVLWRCGMGEVMRHFLEFLSVFSDFENYTSAKSSPTYGSHLDTFSTSLPSEGWSKNVSEPDDSMVMVLLLRTVSVIGFQLF